MQGKAVARTGWQWENLSLARQFALAGGTVAKNGADDPAGDDRGGKGGGKDDGPNHA